MKKLNLRFLAVLIIFSFETHISIAQSTGGSPAGFGINSVLYSNSTFSSGSPLPPAGTVDWFLGTSGRNVIDQANTSTIKSLLQGAAINPTYEARQNGAVHSLADGTIASSVYKELIDAIWARDEFGGTGGTDQTALGIGSKNGQGPDLWSVVSGNVLGKNDLIDVAGHMFRDIDKRTGYNKNDLWFVGLINRAEPSGDAYMDFEFYVRNVAYVPGTGLTSGGDELGHTAFQFDGSGNFSRMGDMLYNMSLTGGGTTVGVEVRIWVSYADYQNVKPAIFNWGPNFDGPVNGSPYGYASIIPKAQNVMYGFVNGAGQLPAAPPWGSRTTKSNIWVDTYGEYSITEMGLNLTAIGLDDNLLTGNNPCDFSWRTFMVKTRSSASFTAALKDFAGPYTWGRPSVDITSSNATLTCSQPVTTLTPVPVIPDATFSWTTADGHILGSTTTTTIQVDRPGNYLLTATLTSGCVIQSPPFVVTSSVNLITSARTTATVSCNGNDGTVDLTVTGGTASRTYSWTKDGSSFPATTEDLSGLTPGTYIATITYDSGCTFVSDAAVVPGKTTVSTTSTVTDATCYGDRNGSISLNVSGKSPFTYVWSNGQTSKDLVNIPAGTYTVTIKDGDGCTTGYNATVGQPSAPLTASITKINDTNADPNLGNGSANLTVTGGTSTYTYSWTGGTFSSTSEDISNLNYGSYSVTVTDAHNCTATAGVFIYQPEICDDNIDNDGNGLTDCDDLAGCKPATPAITGDLAPCAGREVSYSITAVEGAAYQWQYPVDLVTNVSGETNNALTLKWISAVPGQICVQLQNAAGCQSNVSCVTVSPTDKPFAPATIQKN